MTCFLCDFGKNEASMSLLIKTIAGRSRIFSPLRIGSKLMENLLPLGLNSFVMHRCLLGAELGENM
jgi:hypothetical protein